jgi:hypothetical protein
MADTPTITRSAQVETDLSQIRTAVYGREVREAIANGIEHCYDDNKAAIGNANEAITAANNAARAANDAATAADQAKGRAENAAAAAENGIRLKIMTRHISRDRTRVLRFIRFPSFISFVGTLFPMVLLYFR